MKFAGKIIISFVFIIILGCRPDISKYNGDGKIVSTGYDFLSYGYNIDFDNFDLTKRFHAKYIISNNPILKDIYTIGLYIHSPAIGDELKQSLKGVLSLKLISQNNDILIDCSAPLYSWRYEESRFDTYYELFAYMLEDNMRSCFSFNNINKGPFFLTVDYDPKNTDKKINGSIRFSVGGSY